MPRTSRRQGASDAATFGQSGARTDKIKCRPQVREAALKVELCHAKAATRRAVARATAEFRERLERSEADRDRALEDRDVTEKRLRKEHERLRKDARDAKAKLTDAVHDARLEAADHFRAKLADLKKRKPPDPLRTVDPLASTFGKRRSK